MLIKTAVYSVVPRINLLIEVEEIEDILFIPKEQKIECFDEDGNIVYLKRKELCYFEILER